MLLMKLIASQSGAMISGPVLNALVFFLLYFPTSFLCYVVRNFFLLSDGSIRIGIRLIMLAKHFILINHAASLLYFFFSISNRFHSLTSFEEFSSLFWFYQGGVQAVRQVTWCSFGSSICCINCNCY